MCLRTPFYTPRAPFHKFAIIRKYDWRWIRGMKKRYCLRPSKIILVAVLPRPAAPYTESAIK